MADLNYCPACELPADSFQNCGSPNCAVRDYGPGDACAARRAALIVAQRDIETVRPEFESWFAKNSPNTNLVRRADGFYEAENLNALWDRWLVDSGFPARRAAPAAAQLDADNLPPLSGDVIDDEILKSGVMDFRWPTQKQYQDYARAIERQVRAQYAERIRLLERELAERKQSIDTPEFRVLLGNCGFKLGGTIEESKKAAAALIAYIDGRTAGTASEAAPDPTEAAIERRAKEIYAGFVFADRYPWVDGGNSIRQDEARNEARREFAAAPSTQENAK